MKPLVALVHGAVAFVAGLLLSDIEAEAAFFPGSEGSTHFLVLPVQYGPYRREYSPLQQYSPSRRQNSIAARAAFCRCYNLHLNKRRLVCRGPGGGTTVTIVDRCY
jgi:hypothetical protein